MPGLIVGLALVGGPVAYADDLTLKDGTTLKSGSSEGVLAVGPTRVLWKDEQQTRFVERATVVGWRDDEGRKKTLDHGDRTDPAGYVSSVSDEVRVRRRGADVDVSLHGDAAILRVGDELRTGPYGRVSFLTPDGALASARGDAIVRFVAGVPSLNDGTLRIRNTSGDSQLLIPEGRVLVRKGQVEVVRTAGISRVVCSGGRATFVSTSGYRVELPRNHSLKVAGEKSDAPASVGASNTNAWPLRLEYGRRRVAIQPGERVVLLGTPSQAPAPKPVAPPQPKLQPVAPSPNLVQAGRVIRSEGAFVLERRGLVARRVDPAQARGFELLQGDRVEAAGGKLVIQADQARLELAKAGKLVLLPMEGGPPYRLLSGQATLETARQASLILPGGELGLLNGAATVAVTADGLRLGVTKGTGGARFGSAVRAELLAPATMTVIRKAGRVSLSLPADGPSSSVTLGGLDHQLRASETIHHQRTGVLEVIELGQTRLELVGGVRCKTKAGPNETRLLEFLIDGSTVVLGPGTYRLAREGMRIVARSLPPGVVLLRDGERAPPAEPKVVAKRPVVKPITPPTKPITPPTKPVAEAPKPVVKAPRAPLPKGTQVTKLANGAVVETVNWGKLTIKYQASPFVVVSGPAGSDLWLGPKTWLRLTKQTSGRTRIETQDGRYMLHDAAAPAFVLRLDGNHKLRLEASKRVIEASSGVELDVHMRKDRYVLAYVFGQAVYVERGRRIEVTPKSGLRTYMAAER